MYVNCDIYPGSERGKKNWLQMELSALPHVQGADLKRKCIKLNIKIMATEIWIEMNGEGVCLDHVEFYLTADGRQKQ